MFVLAFLFSAQIHAAVILETQCAQVTSAPAYAYCVHKTAGSQSPEVMYFLHGAGEDVMSWQNGPAGDQIRSAWQKAGKDAPTVVTVSYGPLWFMAAQNSSPFSGLSEDFVARVMPTIEDQVLRRQFTKRLLFGESMGGFNAAQLYLHHPELFSRVVLGCPALVPVTPYSSLAEIAAFQERNHVSDSVIKYFADVSMRYWPTKDLYQADAPLLVAPLRLNSSYPPVHISCGDADEYGFAEGAKIFADQAKASGVPVVEWQLPKGPHCAMDTVSMARFLLP